MFRSNAASELTQVSNTDTIRYKTLELTLVRDIDTITCMTLELTQVSQVSKDCTANETFGLVGLETTLIL